MTDERTAGRWRYLRRLGLTPRESMAQIQGERLHCGGPSTKSTAQRETPPDHGKPFEAWGERAVVWCEDPGALGLRLVGFADEIARPNYAHMRGRRRRAGWFCSADNITGELARGVVYRLPAKRGEERFLYGVADPNNDAAAVLSLGVVSGRSVDPGVFDGPSYNEGARDAAYLADGMAENYAESKIDNAAAWDMGRDQAEAAHEAQTLRASLRGLLAEIREAGSNEGRPHICETLRLAARRLYSEMHEARQRRDALASEGEALPEDERATYREALGMGV